MLHSLEAASLLELAVELLKVCCGEPVQRDLADLRDDVPDSFSPRRAISAMARVISRALVLS